MQLRRGPPTAPLPPVKTRTLRVLEAPGLAMMRAMTEVSGQVQLANQQQRSSTQEVVVAIEHIAEGSRSVATTAQEIASAAARRGELAAALAGAGWQGHAGEQG